MSQIFVWVAVVSAVLSSFFSLAGYSLRAFRRIGLSETDDVAGRPGRSERLERHLTSLKLTASFCRALCNFLLAISMVYVFNPPGTAWHWGGFLEALLLAAAILAVVGVAIPHAWANYAGDRIVLVTFNILMVFRYLLLPVVGLMQAFDLPIRRLAGVHEGDHDQAHAAKQEILQAASEGAAEGSVESDEAAMIASVIEFGDRQAGAIMTPRTDLFALPIETPWPDACRQVVAAGHTRVPVYSGDLDNIVGVLYAKDLLRYVGGDEPLDLRTVMRKPFFVPETKSLKDLLREFKVRRIHFSVVLDEYGGTAGVVTIEDILEEIVGEIADEYDQAEPALMHRLDDQSAEVDGRMAIEDLNEAMGLEIPADRDYTTVAGLVFSELGYIPRAGETLDGYGARFTVLAADERKITRLKVQLLPGSPADEES